MQAGECPKGTPSGPFGEGGGMSPLGRISNGLGGIRATPQSGCRAARLHPPLVKQPVCQLRENPYMRKDRHCVPGKGFFILLFYIDFFLPLVQRTYFSKEISPCGDRLAIQ